MLARELLGRLHLLTFKDKGPKHTAKDPDPSAPGSSTKSKQVQHPKITLPTFNGDLMKWASFWNEFNTTVQGNDDLVDDAAKLVYLRQAIKDPQTSELLRSASETHIDSEDAKGIRRGSFTGITHKHYSTGHPSPEKSKKR